MASIALQQVSSKFARSNAASTLEKPIALKYVASYLDAATSEQLARACPRGLVYVWGSKFERLHQFSKMLPENCLVLFRRGNMIYRAGVIGVATRSRTLAERLWGVDGDGETWELVYFLPRVWEVKLAASEMNARLNRSKNDHWQGLVAVPVAETEEWRAFLRDRLRQEA